MITPLNPTQPIADTDGIMSLQMRYFVQEVSSQSIIIGSGSPDGIYEANQGRDYMDEDGAPGAVKYVKQKVAIGGNSKLGWVAIG